MSSTRQYHKPVLPVPYRAHPLWRGCIYAHCVGWAKGFADISNGEYIDREDAQRGQLVYPAGNSGGPANASVEHAGRCIKQDPADLNIPLVNYVPATVFGNGRYHPPDGHLSAMCLLKQDNLPGIGEAFGLFGKASAPASTTKTEYNLGNDGSNDRYRWYVTPLAGATEFAVGGGPLVSDRFKQMVGTYDDDEIALWVDGALAESKATSNVGVKDQTAEELGFSDFQSGSTETPEAKYSVAGVWKQKHPDAAIQALWVNPFAMWGRPRSEFMMGPGALGAGAAAYIPDLFPVF